MNARNSLILPNTSTTSNEEKANYSQIVLAGGCFWCTQAAYQEIPQIKSISAGYAYEDNNLVPTYQSVSTGQIKAREAVIITYQSAASTKDDDLTLARILDIYWRHIDPTDAKGQFADRGYHYTTAIYFTSTEQKKHILASKKRIEKLSELQEEQVATEILPLKKFTIAEDYHQNYKQKNPEHYQRYYRGSGRLSFVESFWQKINQQETLPEISENPPPRNKEKEEEKKHWQTSHFNSEEKNKKIRDLQPISRQVTQEEGTERPFANAYWDQKEEGIYVDIVSGEPLFLSHKKFDSGTGWPSFTEPINDKYICTREDHKLSQARTEVRSRIADSHLGHVFADGPNGTMRYCINSAALRFIKKKDMMSEGYDEFIQLLES